MNCLGSALQTCIEFEEQNLQTGLPFDQPISKTNMTAMLQMMQEIHNIMISFEHRLMIDPKTNQTPPLRIMARSETPQSSDSYVRHWCNFCDEAHDPTTCDTFLVAKKRAKGKKTMPTIAAIEIEEISYEVYDTLTRSQIQFWPTPLTGPTSISSKANFNDKLIPKSTFPETRATLVSQPSNPVATQPVGLCRYTPYNNAINLENLKENIIFLDVLKAPKQQHNLTNSLTTSKIPQSSFRPRASQSADMVNFEDLYSEKEVNAEIPSRLEPKYPPFYVLMKIMGKIAHSCLIDGRSSLSIMSKVIMEQLGLTYTSEARNMLTFNKKIQPAIDQIKDLTLTLCSYPEVKTTCNFLLADMEVRNFSMILGREWKYLNGGYLTLDGSHITISHNCKSIIIPREPRTMPYIEKCPRSQD